MAIQNTIAEGSSQYGIAFNNAYWRIATASISRQRDDPKFSVMIDLAAYATSSPTNDTRDIAFSRFHADLADIQAASGDAFLDKCYSWVMAQDDMAGSTAV
tara:strand:+ start:367 stop:669 length:303 start_codon:yes stop_codon:yes gene_type:complete